MDPVNAAFGTEDKDEILLLMIAALLRKVAQRSGRLSDVTRVVIQQSLHWIAATCGLKAISPTAIERIASDTSRDARVFDLATAFICRDASLASKVLVESFRVAISGKAVAAGQLEWLIRFADDSKIPHEFFHFVHRRYCYDAFSDPSAMDALRCLEVSRHAGLEDIKRKYRDLSKQFHPDRHPGVSEEAQKAFAARFVAVTDAYALLIGILEAGRWCRSRGRASLIAANHELIVDCFFCDSAIRLPPEHGVLESARCSACKSFAVFPKSYAEEFVHRVVSRERRTSDQRPWQEPHKPEPGQPESPTKPDKGPRTPGGGVSSPQPSPAPTPVYRNIIAVAFAVTLVLAVAVVGSKLIEVRELSLAIQPAPQSSDSTTSEPSAAPVPDVELPSQSPPKPVRRRDSSEDALAASYSRAATLAESGQPVEAAKVLRAALLNSKTPEPGHIEIWMKCQSLLRSVILRAAENQGVLSASWLSLRREAVEASQALMREYGRQGALAEARNEFELSRGEIAELLAAVSSGVRVKPTAVNKDLDFATAKLMQTKSQMYSEYGWLAGDQEALEMSVRVAMQVVDFCESAFGKDSETTVVARKNLQRKVENEQRKAESPRVTDDAENIFAR